MLLAGPGFMAVPASPGAATCTPLPVRTPVLAPMSPACLKDLFLLYSARLCTGIDTLAITRVFCATFFFLVCWLLSSAAQQISVVFYSIFPFVQSRTSFLIIHSSMLIRMSIFLLFFLWPNCYGLNVCFPPPHHPNADVEASSPRWWCEEVGLWGWLWGGVH